MCDKLKLKYFVIGGTLIGAIRHNGFIPWDNDIDIAMPREDYEKFIKLGQKHLKKNLFIQTYKTDPNYLQNYTKIRDSNTTFIESNVKKHNINHGIFIDIFPLDTLYKFNKIKLKLLNYQITKQYSIPEKRSFKNKLILTISNILYKRKNTQQICYIKDKIYKKGNTKKIKNILLIIVEHGE